MQADSTFPGSEIDMSNMTAKSDNCKTGPFPLIDIPNTQGYPG